MSEPDEAAVQAVAQALHDSASIPIRGGAKHYANHARAVLATPVVADWRRDAERLRSLAARFEEHPDTPVCTGAEIAAMLRGDGA